MLVAALLKTTGAAFAYTCRQYKGGLVLDIPRILLEMLDCR